MKNLMLPRHINLLHLSEQSAQLHGALLIKDMQRLASSLYSEDGEVDVTLGLGTDADCIRFCHVQLKTTVVLQCQRCMEPFNYEIISDFLHGIATTAEEADALPGQYEPVIVRDGLLLVQDIVEDELILKMPIVPMHPLEQCKLKTPMADSGWNKEQEDEQNPFQMLKLLKHEMK